MDVNTSKEDGFLVEKRSCLVGPWLLASCYPVLKLGGKLVCTIQFCYMLAINVGNLLRFWWTKPDRRERGDVYTSMITWALRKIPLKGRSQENEGKCKNISNPNLWIVEMQFFLLCMCVWSILVTSESQDVDASANLKSHKLVSCAYPSQNTFVGVVWLPEHFCTLCLLQKLGVECQMHVFECHINVLITLNTQEMQMVLNVARTLRESASFRQERQCFLPHKVVGFLSLMDWWADIPEKSSRLLYMWVRFASSAAWGIHVCAPWFPILGWTHLGRHTNILTFFCKLAKLIYILLWSTFTHW